MRTGIAGTIAKLFINSKLTPLLMATFLIVGVYSSFLIPREEEPQIDVPLANIFVSYPGATPTEVESRITKPLEKIVSNVTGIENVYTTSESGGAMMIVQFYVGEDMERSLVKLYNEIIKNMDRMPQGISIPLIKTRSIDDVPVLGLTLWSENYSDYQLRRLAQELNSEIEKVKDVAETKVIGGRSRDIRIVLDRDKMEAYNVDPLIISRQIYEANKQETSGEFNWNDEAISVKTGSFFTSALEVERLVVGVQNGHPVYLRQVATIADGPELPTSYVSFGYGSGNPEKLEQSPGNYPAVTISVAKRRGADAMKVSNEIVDKVNMLRAELIPSDVQIDVSRNYGETASAKVTELLMHLLGAIVAVTFVVMLAMGWRGGLVVFISVPITFALTLFSYYFLDYTLNRITLFALVFVTGIVVDDSIIITENMHRHFKMKRMPPWQAAIRSIDEVGNPTILATFTVIAAVLPMVFVSGMMGPYMSPMPIGASIAMMLSLIIALIATPWLGFRLLRHTDKKEESRYTLEETLIYRLYKKTMMPLIDSGWKRWSFIGGITLLLGVSLLLFALKVVTVKILPFDNKNEFQVVIDMPEGTTLERTAMVTKEIAIYLKQDPLVSNYQTYVGASAPINFNGLVRHYDLRRGSNMADIQVNLLDKGARKLQSHEIAKALRPEIQRIAASYDANVKVVEVPPGPPVMSTLVAEVYGPDPATRTRIARDVKSIFNNTGNVVDVDWQIEEDQLEYQFIVNKEKAALAGISTRQVVESLNMALYGPTVSTLYAENEYNQVGISLRLDEKQRSSINDLKRLKLVSESGQMVPVGDIATIQEEIKDKSIHRKNQKQVVYVMADVAGKLESPVYAMLDISDRLKEIDLPQGYTLDEHYRAQPKLENNYGLKWDGEWQITYEVFRDLGAAFAVVLIIIYLLIVGWFQSMKMPLVMMIAIPLSLVGIILGHMLLGAFFTATSMIGMIALAGIMVRNSILLIDFVNLRLNDNIPLKQAVIEAGAVRTVPILLTAGTVVIGAFVILFDPIFQGLAISLMGGTIASTFLTLLIVPLVFYMVEEKKYRRNTPTAKDEKTTEKND